MSIVRITTTAIAVATLNRSKRLKFVYENFKKQVETIDGAESQPQLNTYVVVIGCKNSIKSQYVVAI